MRIEVMIESPILSANLVELLIVSLLGNSADIRTYPGKNRIKGNPTITRSDEAIEVVTSSISSRLKRLIINRSGSIRRFIIDIFRGTCCCASGIISDVISQIKRSDIDFLRLLHNLYLSEPEFFC